MLVLLHHGVHLTLVNTLKLPFLDGNHQLISFFCLLYTYGTRVCVYVWYACMMYACMMYVHAR